MSRNHCLLGFLYIKEAEPFTRRDLPPFKKFRAWRVVSAKVISLPSKEEEAEGVQDVDGVKELSLDPQELSQLSPGGEVPAPVACSSDSDFSLPLPLSKKVKEKRDQRSEDMKMIRKKSVS